MPAKYSPGALAGATEAGDRDNAEGHLGTAASRLKQVLSRINATARPDEPRRTPNSPCIWLAEATVEGRTYAAQSRHGAPNELARMLVTTGLADRPLLIRYAGVVGAISYRSLYAAAGWTYEEGDRPLRRVRYRARSDGLAACSREVQNRGYFAPAGIPYRD